MIAPNSVPQIAWRPLAVVAGITGTILLAFSGRYGFHRDELVAAAAGRDHRRDIGRIPCRA